MSYGNPSSRSKVRLDYKALKKAITDKGNRGRVGEIQCGPNVWARLDGDDIALKLHRTDIVVYHPDGSATLNGGGYTANQLTRHWWNNAGFGIWGLKPNKWTPTVYVLRQYGGYVKFYDGMKVGADRQLISENMPITMRVPNEETKALRKRLLQVYNERYLPHLRFMSLREGRVERAPYTPPTLDAYFAAEDDDVVAAIHNIVHGAALYGTLWDMAPWVFKKWLDRMYTQEVDIKQLYDEVPYQPKEK